MNFSQLKQNHKSSNSFAHEIELADKLFPFVEELFFSFENDIYFEILLREIEEVHIVDQVVVLPLVNKLECIV